MNVQMPDGTIITDVPENITQKELLAKYNKFNTPKIETAGVGEAFVGGTKRMISSLGTGVSGIFNAEEAAKAGEERQKAITERPGASLDKIGQVYDEKGLFPAAREVISQIPSAIAQQAPQLAAALGTARLGAMAGSAFGPVGTVVGGLGGAFLPSFVQQSGTNLERQAQEGTPIDAGAAYSAAVPQAALDVFTDKLLFSKLMGLPVKTLGRAEADAVVAKSLKRTLAEGTAKGVAAEVPTEVAQQMLERYQAGLSLTDDEARKEYADIAYQTALIGPLGAIGKFQERGEAKRVVAQDEAVQAEAAQRAQAQAQREATGVMDQLPLFTEEEAPTPAGPMPPEGFTPPTQEETPISEPETSIPGVEVPTQGELFTPRGKPSPEALASVETGRLQSLPAQIAELNKTPEGRAELAGNMKLYFPDLSIKERNKTRQAIQQGVYGVEPVAPAEGILTPELLKTFGITPSNRNVYKALKNANLADPTTYNLLTVLASGNSPTGVYANRILEAFPHYNPNAVQPDLFGVPNAPQTQPTAEPSQPDLFGFPEDGVPATTEQPGTEPSVGVPIQPEETTPEEVAEPDGTGVVSDSGVPQPNVRTTRPSKRTQPSALAPVPKSVAKDAAAELKKEPVATTWSYFSDIPFGKLSKIGKDKVKQAHKDGYLTQDTADDIESIEIANTTKANVSTRIATGSPEMAVQLLSRKIDEAVANQQELEDDPTATQEKKNTAAKKVAKIKKQLDKLSTEEATTTKAPDASESKTILEPVVKQYAQDAVDGFLIGDSVRYGNLPGTVVGFNGDYVKFRPDTATNPKAYHRVQKTQLKLVSRPASGINASASKNSESKFGTEAGQLNADMAGIIQLLGSNMYAASLADVSIKELLQNSFDAVKAAVKVGLIKEGDIKIDINSNDRTIKFTDNARGMTTDIVKNAFFTVAGSDKSDLDPSERSGGLGLAKMGFMMGAERLKLDTVRDGVRTVVDTTSLEIAKSAFKLVKTPAPKNAHGTTVEVKIPEYYTDSNTGEQKYIYFPYSTDVQPLTKPLIGPTKVTVSFTGYGDTDTKVLPVGVNFDTKEMPLLTKANFSWGSADIYFGVNRNDKPKHRVLSSGVYQFDEYYELARGERLPFDVIVNIKPNVDAKHPDYPFENSRERFKPRLKEDMESLQNFLRRVARGEEAKNLQESFKGIVSMPRIEAGEDVAEVSKKLKKVFDQRGAGETKFELPPMPKSIVIKDNIVSDDKGRVIVDKENAEKKSEKNKESTFEAENEAPGSDKFMLKMEQDPKLPIFHNNTNVDFIDIGKAFGDPQAFFAELGTLMVDMKEELAKSKMWGYEQLSPDNLFFGGISVDKGYGGVHIKVPYKAVLLNPFYDWGAKSLFGIRQNLLNTMIHEIAHQGDMSHGVGHNGQMIKVEQYLADVGMLDYFRDAIMDTLVRHESTFTAMREAYGKSTTKNTAKSLEDYAKGSASARGVNRGGGNTARTVPSGGGQGRNGNIQANSGPTTQRGNTVPGRGNAAQINPVAQAQARQFIAGMSGTLAQSVPTQPTTTTQVLGNIATTMVNNPSGAFGMIEEMANKFRTKVIDKAANLSAAIQDANGGAFYNVNGKIRADLLLSAANNVNNFINAVFTRGGMEILPNGSMRAKDANHSVDGVFRHAKRLGEQLGVEEARALITGVFYHYRAKSIIANVPRDQWPENWQKDPRIVPTQAQINAAMAAFNQYPELRAMQTEFIGAKNEMVKFLKQAGFLSDAKATQFLADDSYAPWLRLKDYQSQIPGLGNTGRMVDLRQMKALVGGTEEVNDMLENMAQMIGWCVRSGVANHTANSALNTMSTMGTATRSSMRPTTGNPAHVVMVYEAGKPVYWTVDNPYDLAAFQTVSGMNSGVMKTIGTWLGRLRAGIVLFPAFPLRQVVMDSQRAFITSGVDKPWAMMGKIYKSFLTGEAFRGTNADIQELMNQGVVGAADYTAYDSTRGRASQFGMGEAPKTISDKFVATKGYNYLQKLAYSADLAVRLGIYRQTMEETGDKTLAATRAREIINFQKSGTSQFVNTLKQTIPFMGAYLQGMDVNYKGMVGRGNSMKQRKAAAAAYWGNMAMYAGLVTLYTMSRSGDDDYEEQKGFITDRNFVIPGGGLIPVPTDVGFLGKVIPERITDYILQSGTENPESLTRLRQGILEAAAAGFTPPSAVYGVLPAVELATNYSFFSDMPIVSERLKGLAPFQQYTASTSEFAKNVGDVLNFSPMKIDYIFNAIGGTSAGALLQFADVVMGSNKMAADKYPVIGSFQQKTVGGRYAEEYYALRELTEQAYKTATAIQAEGDEAKLEEYINQPEIQARLAARDAVESLHTEMNKVSHQRNLIMSSPDLTPDEKRQLVNELMASVEAGLRDMQIRRVRSEVE